MSSTTEVSAATPAVEKQQPTASASSSAESIKSFLSGGFGGMALVFVGHPFDLVKVRIQTSSEYKGAMDCVRRTIAKEGVRGLYRGMSTPLVGVTPLFSVCFWGYDLGKNLMSMASGNSKKDLTLTHLAIAGGISALPATALMTPIERVKCLLQVQDSSTTGRKFTGPVDVVKTLYREGGIRSIYKGTGATLLRDIPGSMAYFGGYEVFKKMLTPKGSRPEDLSPLATLVAGGMAGIANWSVAIPADVIKSRLQTAPEGTYSGTLDCFMKLMKNEGPGALFKGVAPVMLRAFPANAACFMAVEASRKMFDLAF